MAEYTIETLTGWVSTAASKVDGVGGQLKADRQKIEENRRKIPELEKELDLLRASAGALQSQVAALESAAKNSGDDENADSIRTQLSQARAELSGVQGQISQMNGKISRIREQNKQLWQQIHVHTAKLRQMDGTMEEVSSALEEKYQERASAKAQFDKVSAHRFGASAGASAASRMQSAMNDCRSSQSKAAQIRAQIRALLQEETDLVDWNEEDRDPTVSPEDRKYIVEQEDSGETEDWSDMSLDRSYSRLSGELLSREPIVIDMPYRADAKYSKEEFIDQALYQEYGLNNLSVADFLRNYENRRKNGRSPEGSERQKEYAEGLREDIKFEAWQRNKNLTPEQLESIADYRMSGGAALHDPDQVAGGSPDGIHSYGSGKVNSALGSLWGHGRADRLYQQVLQRCEGRTMEQLESIYLNVRLNIHPR